MKYLETFNEAKIFKKKSPFQKKTLFVPSRFIKPYNSDSDVESLSTIKDVEIYLEDDFSLEDYAHSNTRLSEVPKSEREGDITFMFKDKKYKAEWHLEEEYHGFQSGYYCFPVIDNFYEV
jgi:hypothetical protein